jgi:hypothetical protein
VNTATRNLLVTQAFTFNANIAHSAGIAVIASFTTDWFIDTSCLLVAGVAGARVVVVAIQWTATATTIDAIVGSCTKKLVLAGRAHGKLINHASFGVHSTYGRFATTEFFEHAVAIRVRQTVLVVDLPVRVPALKYGAHILRFTTASVAA